VGREGSLNEDVVMSCILAGSGKVPEQGRTSQTVKPTVIQGQTVPTTIICTFEATLGSGIGFTAMSGSCRLDKQGWGYGGMHSNENASSLRHVSGPATRTE